ncbi:MAG: hypothetical protein JJT89_10930 [Nitriliruptoraceae bacterium]|nr:hypothetical protein [Nitriliruptoraceae bacterium]
MTPTEWSEGAPGWAHAGLAVLHDGRLLTADPRHPALVTLDPGGAIAATIPLPTATAHGLSLSPGGGSTRTSDVRVWIADDGVVRAAIHPGRYEDRAEHDPPRGSVVAVDLDGMVRARLPTPPDVDATHPYRPTSVALDPRSGTVFVADGYGRSRIHRYDADGTHRGWFDGTATPGGHFDVPHALVFDRARGGSRLLVLDREHGRICVFDPTGRFRGILGGGELRRPAAAVRWGEDLVVADLTGRLSVYGPDDVLRGHLAAGDPLATSRPDWPNRRTAAGVAPPATAPGVLNSPHDIAVLHDGRLAVCEWVLGGRVVLITP